MTEGWGEDRLVRKRAESVREGCFSAGGISNVTASAQKHATDDAVYTALFTLEYILSRTKF